jgi:hypothetical protein
MLSLGDDIEQESTFKNHTASQCRAAKNQAFPHGKGL